MLKRTCLPPYFLVSIAITVAAGLYAHYLGRPAWAFMVASASVAAVVGRGIDRGDLMSIPAAAGTIAGVVSGAMVLVEVDRQSLAVANVTAGAVSGAITALCGYWFPSSQRP